MIFGECACFFNNNIYFNVRKCDCSSKDYERYYNYLNLQLEIVNCINSLMKRIITV